MRILYFTRADSVHDQRFMAALAESGHEGFVLRLVPGDYPTPSGVKVVEWGSSEIQLTENDIPRLTEELNELLKGSTTRHGACRTSAGPGVSGRKDRFQTAVEHELGI
jgi:hypothetical protein